MERHCIFGKDNPASIKIQECWRERFRDEQIAELGPFRPYEYREWLPYKVRKIQIYPKTLLLTAITNKEKKTHHQVSQIDSPGHVRVVVTLAQ